ncbi:molybdopterin cofactor-binding domain-containing protein [Psychrobacter sp. AOP22-C1-22]|uniref:xanthine dehydrogenase family protein molybdopterin-binding subunit n=1 Tax=unclassified Psychrobacter TaxID=196806 RepID=UPI001787F582|nr:MULTISPECIES: xanthine dehydrogenase family protein molybdopterin-binding subunit [unclassified Psychrobacter]MDN5801423.1 xanthine dehydrogenase family protein molybdopterin-binding subunit [Psychrobacter sp.]MBE0407476.1 xanthine dehydrogenase family protein molybdopterin-binding subunit [Psychrobacter sp. FME6]MBE0443806.1 xanthine dehydrogenase family protein molybdopterin-binding subunit [Psychrobacter sp. FME5]MDN5890775.1 xanthine dehydrogenase family protein molybdopterin-binding sub
MSLLDSVFASEPTKKMTMNEPVETLFNKTASNLVGKPINRVDGSLKVSGQAPYSAEIHRENQLYGVLVSAKIAKGRVENIDSSALENIPGIIKVVTDPKHFLRNAQQGGATKAPTQGASEIFYHGQPIAVVIAETFEAATEGANALKVSYKDEAEQAALNFTKELSSAHDVDEKNGSDKNAIKGDPEQGLADSAVTLDRFYHTPSQSNSPMEPHATLAYWEDDRLIMYTSNQMIASCKQQVMDALDLTKDQVQLISYFVGGGFGSKLGIAPESIAAAIAAKELGRPVLISMTRPQVMEATVRRSNTRQRIAIGCDKDGIINTMIHDTITSNLPGEAFFEPTALSTKYLYRGENRRVNYKKVDMNQVLSGSMRAPGEAVGMIAVECAMDELASQLNIDPIELRRRNEPEQDPSQDIPFSTRQLTACMQQAAEQFGWDKRNAKPASQLEGDWWIGTGMAASARGNQLKLSEARATLQVDDTKKLGIKAIIETDMTDIGTGSYTVFSQVAADLLGLPIDHIEMKLGDSDLPPAVGSGGSMGAASAGSGVYLACEQLRDMLAEKVGLHSDSICFDNGQIKQAGQHNSNVTEAAIESVKNKAEDLTDKVAEKTGLPLPTATDKKYDFTSFHSYALADVVADYDEQKISAKGQIKPGKNAKSHRQASFGANFAEVAVHRVTGEIRVKRMVGAFAAGRILNHKTATSQCYGGMVFGIGSALMEEVIHDKRDGRLCNHDLAEYHIPVNADVPQLEVILVEEDDPYTNPMHIKGIGETAISGAAAAIANAIYNAVGVRVYDFPITLDKLLYELPE